jgi:hypothetical protein
VKGSERFAIQRGLKWAKAQERQVGHGWFLEGSLVGTNWVSLYRRLSESNTFGSSEKVNRYARND